VALASAAAAICASAAAFAATAIYLSISYALLVDGQKASAILASA
jgi:hypothetical protein